MLRVGFCYGYGDGGYGDGGYGGGGDGDGYGDGGGDGYGGGYGGDGYGGDGYGDGGGGGGGDGGDGGGDGGGGGDVKFSEGFGVIEGLYIVCSPGGYYPYVRIGWCRRDDIWIEMHNCRVIKRFGTNAELAKIAKEGPKSNTNLLSVSKMERVCVAMASRVIECAPLAWVEACPKPESFAEVAGLV